MWTGAKTWSSLTLLCQSFAFYCVGVKMWIYMDSDNHDKHCGCIQERWLLIGGGMRLGRIMLPVTGPVCLHPSLEAHFPDAHSRKRGTISKKETLNAWCKHLILRLMARPLYLFHDFMTITQSILFFEQNGGYLLYAAVIERCRCSHTHAPDFHSATPGQWLGIATSHCGPMADP